MQPISRRVRPRLTPALLGWILVDVAGLLLMALGGAYFIQGKAAFIPGLPGSSLQALICVFGGIGTILVAAVKMLAEVFYQQRPQQDGALEE